MKNVLLGAGISMGSTGGTLVALGQTPGGWLIAMGVVAALAAIIMNSNEPDCR